MTSKNGSGKLLEIDFLYSEDCPSHERALELLHDVLRGEGINAPPISIQKVETEDDARRLAFPGSPTIRVNGRDIIDDAELPVGLSCRAYRREDGRITPLPPRDAIVRAVRGEHRSETGWPAGLAEELAGSHHVQ